MAGKTLAEMAELIAELRGELGILRAELESLNTAFDRPEYLRVRERIAKIESLLAVVDPTALIRKVATLEEQVAELKKWKEESDRRRWQVLLAVGVCVLTFTSNIVINLLLFFARKPG